MSRALGAVASRVSEMLSDLIARPLAPGLYLVATPIGNLADISLRALSVLVRADLIAAEDTRHSKKLLTHFGIGGALGAYHEHNAERERPRLIARLRGRTVGRRSSPTPARRSSLTPATSSCAKRSMRGFSS